jgi:hypothetical protein
MVSPFFPFAATDQYEACVNGIIMYVRTMLYIINAVSLRMKKGCCAIFIHDRM